MSVMNTPMLETIFSQASLALPVTASQNLNRQEKFRSNGEAVTYVHQRFACSDGTRRCRDELRREQFRRGFARLTPSLKT